MPDLRKMARGQKCLVRLPGCDGGGETTVLSHYRLSGYAGVALKPDDYAFGAWCCASCHDLVDGRRKTGIAQHVLRLAHAEGVMRTQAEVRKRLRTAKGR